MRTATRGTAHWRAGASAERRVPAPLPSARQSPAPADQSFVSLLCFTPLSRALSPGGEGKLFDDNEAGASSGNTFTSRPSSLRILWAAIRSLLLTVRSDLPMAAAISRLV